MTQVIMVDRSTGKFDYIDMDGNVVPKEYSFLETGDHNVLISRIMADLLEVGTDKYFLTLSGGNQINVTTMIDYVDDKPILVETVDRTYCDWANLFADEGMRVPYSKMAVFNLANGTLGWVSNPMSPHVLVSGPEDACESDNTIFGNIIFSAVARKLNDLVSPVGQILYLNYVKG